MKDRPEGFLATRFIDHNSEQFDYVRELHGYLWRFISALNPGISGNLSDLIDPVLEKLEESIMPVLEVTAKETITTVASFAVEDGTKIECTIENGEVKCMILRYNNSDIYVIENKDLISIADVIEAMTSYLMEREAM